ncbi:MAG: TrkA family potassium uptake protein [Clostridiales bacterium]|nr:TrkA family potassium uptake protein [Clostridiales bacterium]
MWCGEVGLTVINCFLDSSIDFVVVEENEKRFEELDNRGILVVLGNATHEDTLQKAGIENAKGIVCTLPTDAENVFIVLTAKEMKDDIYIVSKAIDKSAHRKLLKAGANKTISPNEIGGQRIAALILRPAVISFLDVITRAGDVILDLEEVIISSHSNLVGMKLFEAKIPEQTGLSILALKKKDTTTFKFNPSSNEILNDGDTMVVLGEKEQVEKLRTMVNI